MFDVQIHTKSIVIYFPEEAQNAYARRTSLMIVILNFSKGTQIHNKNGSFDKSVAGKLTI